MYVCMCVCVYVCMYVCMYVLTLMHQVYFGNTQTEINNLFKKKEDNVYDMRRGFQLDIVQCKSEVGRNSLRYIRRPLIWNSLPTI